MPKWNGGVIGVANNPTQSSAKGIWSLSEATKAIRAGLWPPSNAGADPYFENVTLLLPGDGTNGAQNNTFLDSSTNNFTITRNGNTTQGTFTPFSKPDGRWSNYFDGTGDFLSVANNAAFNFGSGAFTIEFWYYPTTLSGTQCLITNYGGSTTGFVIQMGGSTAGSGKIDAGFSGDGADITSTNGLTANTWNHIAISGTPGATGIKLFINGAQEGSTYTGATSLDTSSTLLIGEVASTNRLFGYLCGLRITKGGALYTATFTPPTSPPTTTVSSGTVSLLTCQSNRFIDNSTNAFAITRNGDVSVQTFSPFPTLTAYAAGTNGGSGYFDGTGDYLTIANSAALSYGTGSFTIEGFFNTSAAGQYAALFSDESSGGTSGLTLLMNPTAGNGQLAVYGNGGLLITATGKYNDNAWHHFAVSRDSTNLRLYVDGAYIGASSSGSTNFDASSSLYLMSSVIAGRTNSGYLSSFRTLKGTALYTGTSSITVPTGPLTAITNTSLLLNYTNGGIIDTSMSNDLETVGNAQISTTQSKFGGASMYFDGTGDYLKGNALTAGLTGSGDFTIEGWVYISSLPGAEVSFCSTTESGGTGIIFGLGGGGNVNKLQFAIGNLSVGNPTVVDSVNFTTGAWVHFAAVRYNGTIYLYKNGTSVGTPTSATATLERQTVTIGAWPSGASTLTGYIDDLRISKGLARYTANFTAPVGPFNGFGD